MTTSMLAPFRPFIASQNASDPQAEGLLIERSTGLACHYAPFDYVNIDAKVVLLGLTPGAQQATNALDVLRAGISSGLSDAEALKSAKEAASFSGPMRRNLVAMLDHLGLQSLLGIESCAHLFSSHSDLVHFTSTLRYPVFAHGLNYSGSPAVLKTPFLLSMCDRWLAQEIDVLAEAWWIPLGSEAKAVIAHMAKQGRMDPNRILDGMPHPSGANAERIAYFLGTKTRDVLSSKTDPDRIDQDKRGLVSKLAAANGTSTLTKNQAAPRVPVQNHATVTLPAPKASVTKIPSNSRFARSFVLRDHLDRPLYPVRSRNGTFTLAPRGKDMHHAAHAIHVEDEDTAFQMVASGTYKIRAVREQGQAPSLLGLGDRAVKSAERI